MVFVMFTGAAQEQHRSSIGVAQELHRLYHRGT